MKKKGRRLVRKDRVVVVTCRTCGWRWKPSPKKWRNRYNVVSERTLQCPSCGIKNYIDKETIGRIHRHNK